MECMLASMPGSFLLGVAMIHATHQLMQSCFDLGNYS